MELFNSKEIKDLTLIELNYLINKTKENHDSVKVDIDILLDEYDLIEKGINKKVEELKEVEKKYIELVTELNNR